MSFQLIGSARTITLRNPDFGDTISLENSDIKRFTIGGAMKTYYSSQWAKFKKYKYTFSAIRNTENLADPTKSFIITALRQLLVEDAGSPIQIIDHLGNTVNGFIIAPVTEIIAKRPNCSYSLTLEIMETPI